MSVTPRTTKGGTVYWVVTRGHAERVGKDRRAADRLDAQRKREVKAGTFAPAPSGAVSVAKYLWSWIAARKKRSARVDRSAIEHHILLDDPDRVWFGKLRMIDVEPRHVQKLIDDIKATGGLKPKTLYNVFGTLRTAFRAAVRRGVIDRDVCLLDPGTVSKKSDESTPYSLDEARALLAKATLGRRAWAALAFFTGMRCGEVCGRRWRDYDPGSMPLGSLLIATQYNDEPLKTDSPRKAPVHPELAAVLEAWRVEWELVYLRKPTPEDFIVPRPRSVDEPLSNSMAYKAWDKLCAQAGVPNRTQHATRHTFLTEAQRGGANDKVIERVTHNAENTMVDHYTHWAWDPLCRAVLCLPSFVDSGRGAGMATQNGSNLAPAVGLEQTVSRRNHAKLAKATKREGANGPAFPAGFVDPGAEVDASPESGRAFAAAVVEHEERGRALAIRLAPLPAIVKVALFDRARAQNVRVA